MAESLAAATENQGNDTPHTHGIMALVTPYQYMTLLEVRDLIKKDVSKFEKIKRFIAHMCREDHFDDERHQNSLESRKKLKQQALQDCHISELRPSLLFSKVVASRKNSLHSGMLRQKIRRKLPCGKLQSTMMHVSIRRNLKSILSLCFHIHSITGIISMTDKEFRILIAEKKKEFV